jgi:hypothetical protein
MFTALFAASTATPLSLPLLMGALCFGILAAVGPWTPRSAPAGPPTDGAVPPATDREYAKAAVTLALAVAVVLVALAGWKG